MTVNVGTMQLPVPEDPDAVRTYLNGTHVSGGLWTSLTRASNHDHSGGLNGIQLTATSIPDGSITSAKLDPAVLLPYALVDGSKPFTGTVTMNADQLIRDTLRFGAKPAGVADATLARTGAGALRVDTHLGVGVNPAAWRADLRAIQVGAGVILQGYATGASYNAYLGSNTYQDDTGFHALVAGEGLRLGLVNGTYQFYTAPSVAAGALQTFTQRANIATTGTLTLTPDASQMAIYFNGGPAGTDWGRIRSQNTFEVLVGSSSRATIAQNGTLTLTPDAGANAIVAGGAVLLSGANKALGTSPGTGTNDMGISAAGGNILIAPGAGYVMPDTDGTKDMGHPSYKWYAFRGTTGTIQTSSAEVKEGITPLSPAECYQAAKDVRWYEYAYLPPVYTPPEPPPDIAYDAADDNETKAEKKAARDEAEAQAREAHAQRLVETAPARNQRGFVFPAGAESKDEAGGALPPVPDLFGLSDRESTTPQADLATLGCALQEVIRRLEALEAPN